jgi:multidrug resistance efflux pump
MNRTHEPNPQFVERLEWQLATEYRRMTRQRSSGRVAVPRRMVAFAIVAGVLLTGVAAIRAAEFVQDAWRKKIEVARAETEVLLQQARLESGREMAARTETLAAKGLAHQEEYRVLKLGQEQAGLDLERARLNLEEVKRSGVAPRDELYAPFVGGRDFVSERLAVEIKKIELDAELLADRLTRLRGLQEKGLVSRDEPDSAERETAARKGLIDEIAKRLELRKRFVAGRISAREVEIAGRLAVAEANLNSAQSKVESLTKQLERQEALQSERLISPSEAAGLRSVLDTAQAELKLAALEVDILKKAR